MLNDEMKSKLIDYLDGNLSSSERGAFEETLHNNSELREELDVLIMLRQQASDWQEQPVPEWHRNRHLIPPKALVTHWTQWFSMATSMAALVVVIASTFVGSNDSSELLAAQRQQEQWLQRTLIEMEQRHSERLQTVSLDTLDSCRQERRRDLQQVSDYWVQARNEDRIYMNEIAANQYRGQQAVRDYFNRVGSNPDL